ncbi:MAG TPA: C4-dicarboxylate ABC transporter, partial [Eggerthellaceae bacterium]|nr:C4-dicarboxylate ABC transporter [Eggerthellaceae bacterium]
AFIVPYILAFNPIMVLEGDFAWFQVGQVVLTSIVGLFGVSAAMNGHLFTKINPVFRVLFAAGGLCMMAPDSLTDVIGIGIIAALVVVQYLMSKRHKNAPAAPAAA